MDAGAALANVQALETGRASLGRGRDLGGMNFTAMVREARRLGVYSDGMSRADLVAAVQGAAAPVQETPGAVQESPAVYEAEPALDAEPAAQAGPGQANAGRAGIDTPAREREAVSRQILSLANGIGGDTDTVELGRTTPAVSEALKRAGFNVPAGTPHLADGMRLRHVRRGHPDLTDADFSGIPDVVGSPDLVGATRNNEGLQRVWLLKQGEDDRLHIAVYGQRKGQLRMLTHYKEDADVILKDLKMKGVPLVAVAKPPLSLEGDPGGQSGRTNTGTPNEDTIPPANTSGNMGGRASLGRFQKVNAPHSEQKGWGKGNLSERAERAIAEGKRTSRMIAEDYGVSRGVVESTLRTNEWHHVLEPGRKTPGMVDFYNFQPDEDAGDAAVLREMQEREKLARKARAGKAAFSRELRRRGFQVEGGRYVNLPDGRIVGSIAGQPGNFGVDLSAALVRKYAWEDVAPLGDLNWGQGELSREQWLRLTGQSDLEEEVESPAKGGEPGTIGAQPDSRRGSRVSAIGGESAEALPIPTAPDTLSVAEMFGVRNSPDAPDVPPASGGRASLGTAADLNSWAQNERARLRAARALEIAAAPGDIAARPGLGNPGQTAAAQRMVNAVDQARAEEGDPQRRKDTERDLEADNIPEAQAKRNRERLLAGEQADFSDAEIVRLRKDLNAAMEHAIRTGSKEDALNVATMIDAWRGLGTEQARSFRAIPQPGTLVSKWRPFRGEATKPASGIYRHSLRNCAQHPWRLVP